MLLVTRVIAVAACAAMPVAAAAGTFNTIYSFQGGTDEGDPTGTLMYHDGALYGTTTYRNGKENGEVFKFKLSTGELKKVYAFKGGTDGSYPTQGVIYQQGFFYGVTQLGGTDGCGTIFSIDAAAGTEKVLYSFASEVNCVVGLSGLIYVSGGLYGTTRVGGAFGDGSVFGYDTNAGSFTPLHSFSAGKDGWFAGEPLTYQGNLLYGVTLRGGPGTCSNGGCGTLFSIDPATGDETILPAFLKKKFGWEPSSNLVYYDGSFYGATFDGGPNKNCTRGCGVSYAVNATTGLETVLDAYDATRESPYGITRVGQNAYEVLPGPGQGEGELLQVNLKSGKQTILYTFMGGTDGSSPSPLTYSHGALYGFTSGGGKLGCYDGGECGTIFKYVP